MIRSSDRILTTHTGSLPRPDALVGLLRAKDGGGQYDKDELNRQVRNSVAAVVAKQSKIGIDVIDDGEHGKSSFAAYLRTRLGGFESTGKPFGFQGESRDSRQFFEAYEEMRAMFSARESTLKRAPVSALVCTGPVTYTGHDQVKADIEILKSALEGKPASEASGHLNMELFRMMARIELTHVPYKVVNQAFTDLVGGRIQLSMSPVPGLLPFIKNGQMRALGIASESRNAALPDVPLIKETQGLERYSTSTTYALFAPAKTPREILGRLNTEVRRVVINPDMKEKLIAAGVEPRAGNPEDVTTMLRTEIQKWSEVVKAAKIAAD